MTEILNYWGLMSFCQVCIGVSSLRTLEATVPTDNASAPSAGFKVCIIVARSFQRRLGTRVPRATSGIRDSKKPLSKSLCRLLHSLQSLCIGFTMHQEGAGAMPRCEGIEVGRSTAYCQLLLPHGPHRAWRITARLSFALLAFWLTPPLTNLCVRCSSC